MQLKLQNFRIHNYFLVLTYLLLASTTYSMNMMTTLRLSLQKQPNNKEMAENFVREFPLMTLKNVQYRYNKCSDTAKKKIIQILYREENKQISSIFAYATQYPEEISKQILYYLFEGNKSAENKFFNFRIIDFYDLYQWSHDVYEGKRGIPSTLNLRSIDIIFQLSDEIKRTEFLVAHAKDNLYLRKQDIKILQTIIRNSKSKDNTFMGEQFKYRFYQKYTTEDVIRCLVPTGLISGCLYVPMTVVLLSRLIETYCCSQIIRDISLDTKIKQLVELVHHNGDLSLLNAVCTPQSNMMYSWLDHGKKNIPFLLTIPSIGFLASLPRPTLKDFLFLSGIYGTIFSIAGYLCSWIPFEKLPGGFVGLYCAIPLLSFVVMNLICFKNGRHSWRSRVIDWQNIDEELNNRFMCIPEESRIL